MSEKPILRMFVVIITFIKDGKEIFYSYSFRAYSNGLPIDTDQYLPIQRRFYEKMSAKIQALSYLSALDEKYDVRVADWLNDSYICEE